MKTEYFFFLLLIMPTLLLAGGALLWNTPDKCRGHQQLCHRLLQECSHQLFFYISFFSQLKFIFLIYFPWKYSEWIIYISLIVSVVVDFAYFWS